MQPDQFSPAGPLTTSPARGLLRFSSLPSLLCHRPVGPAWQTRLRRRHRTSTELSRRRRVSRADSIAIFAPHLSRGFLCRLYSLATCDPLRPYKQWVRPPWVVQRRSHLLLAPLSTAENSTGPRERDWELRAWNLVALAIGGQCGIPEFLVAAEHRSP
jgi:hypothetical protein